MRKTTSRRTLSAAGLTVHRPSGVHNVRYMSIQYMFAIARDIAGELARLAANADQAAREEQFPEAIAATAQAVEKIDSLAGLYAAAGELYDTEHSMSRRTRAGKMKL